MVLSPRHGFFMQPLYVGLELLAIDPPDTAAPDLDRRKFPGSDQCVHLRNADAEIGPDVLEGEETGLYLAAGLFGPRRAHASKDTSG